MVGHISEGPIAIVVVQGAPRAFRVGSGFYSERVREVDVQAAIFVVVKQRDTTTHRLDDIFLVRRGEVLETNSG